MRSEARACARLILYPAGHPVFVKSRELRADEQRRARLLHQTARPLAVEIHFFLVIEIYIYNTSYIIMQYTSRYTEVL